MFLSAKTMIPQRLGDAFADVVFESGLQINVVSE